MVIEGTHYVTNPQSGCWEWVRFIQRGYGQINRGGVKWGAHRWIWTQVYGDIPKGLYVCHTCDNKKCINPEHLFLGTQLDNMKDMYAKGRQGRKGRYTTLSPELIYKIRDELGKGAAISDISAQFSIPWCTVNDIGRFPQRYKGGQ